MTSKPLTQRETQVLILISQEATNHEIAELLYISQHTVVTYRKNLLQKLAVRNTAGMIRRAFELGYLRIAA